MEPEYSRVLLKKLTWLCWMLPFLKDGEINRDMSEVPHPFVEESMGNYLMNLSIIQTSKEGLILFISIIPTRY